MLISENILIIILLVLMVLYAHHIWKNRRLYYYGWKFEGPLNLPIIGSAYYFIGGTGVIVKRITWMLNKYQSPFVKLWIGNYFCILPKEPKYIEIILKNHLEKSPMYEAVKMGLKNGLVTAPVEIWKSHRKIINHTMHQNILNSFVDIFVKHSNKCVEELKGNCGPLDLLPIVFTCTVNMICETTMDTKPTDFGEQHKFILRILRCQEMLIQKMFKPWWMWLWAVAFAKEFYLNYYKSRKFVEEIIQMKHRETTQSETKKKYFLNYLISLQNDKLTDDEILDETYTMIIAGSETTALTEGYVLLMLALHPEIQENVYREILAILGDSGPITHQNLNQMDYLDRVIKETLRLFPTIPLIGRFLHEDIRLDSFLLPKGSTIIVSIAHLHLNPEFWTDPFTFNPDRFLPGEVAKRPPCSYIPFSTGNRNCIGFKYGLMSMKVLLASLIRCFKITTTQYKTINDIKIEYGVTIKPINGIKISLEKRQ